MDIDGFEISGPRLERYLQRRRDDVCRAKVAVKARTWEVIKTLGHQWKGNGITFGFPEISEWGKSLEKAGIAENSASAENTLNQMEEWLTLKGF